jgi:hypothetical protein
MAMYQGPELVVYATLANPDPECGCTNMPNLPNLELKADDVAISFARDGVDVVALYGWLSAKMEAPKPAANPEVAADPEAAAYPQAAGDANAEGDAKAEGDPERDSIYRLFRTADGDGWLEIPAEAVKFQLSADKRQGDTSIVWVDRETRLVKCQRVKACHLPAAELEMGVDPTSGAQEKPRY